MILKGKIILIDQQDIVNKGKILTNILENKRFVFILIILMCLEVLLIILFSQVEDLLCEGVISINFMIIAKGDFILFYYFTSFTD